MVRSSALPLRPLARSTRPAPCLSSSRPCWRPFSSSESRPSTGEHDPRIKDLIGREIAGDYAKLRSSYASPKHPVVLAHGLLGFSTIELAGNLLPPIQYWHGIRAALEARGCHVVTPSVPQTATISARAARLAAQIADSLPEGTPVNVIAHSMGGLDARLLTSPAFADQLSETTARRLNVASLTTISTPHRGSAYADHVISMLGPARLARARRVLRRATGWDDTGAFEQLTPQYMKEVFNPATPDHPDTRYFSYGAMMAENPPLFSPFRSSHAVINGVEGPNDGLVSVESSKWGTYEGTIVGVSHLALINWTNKLGWKIRGLFGQKEMFNALAFYLEIADRLAKEGL